MLDDLHSNASCNGRIACLRFFNPVGAHPYGRIGEDPRGIPNTLFPLVSQDITLCLPPPHKVGVMKKSSPTSKRHRLCLAVIVSVAGGFQATCVSAQSSLRGAVERCLELEQQAQMKYGAYFLGGGLQIEFLDPALSV